jgi:hypothetical protein
MIEPKTIDGARATILYNALSTAILVTRERMKLKSADAFRGAIEMQLSAYEGEKAELAREFPQLSNGNGAA